MSICRSRFLKVHSSESHWIESNSAREKQRYKNDRKTIDKRLTLEQPRTSFNRNWDRKKLKCKEYGNDNEHTNFDSYILQKPRTRVNRNWDRKKLKCKEYGNDNEHTNFGSYTLQKPLELLKKKKNVTKCKSARITVKIYRSSSSVEPPS